MVVRSVTEGTGGKPRGGRVIVRTGAGLVLTDGWKSLITSSLSFCKINLSLIISSLACSCCDLTVVSESDLTQPKIAVLLSSHHPTLLLTLT